MDFLHIIFSKDRALQLKAQLDSIKLFVSGPIKHVILYKCSDLHKKSYMEVKDAYSDDFVFVEQTNFRQDVIDILLQCSLPYVFFTPDDGLFIREVDLSFINSHLMRDFIPSLRLGNHLVECHPRGKVPQKLPDFKELGDNLIWDWKLGELDWGYPLALDGHIFDFKLFLTYLSFIDFKTPTSFEIALQKFVPINLKYGICQQESSFVSLPWNAVTDEISNLSGGISNSIFLDEYNKGNKIKVDHIYNTLPISCHQEYELEFECAN